VPNSAPTVEGVVNLIDYSENFQSRPRLGIVVIGCMPQLLCLKESISDDLEVAYAIQFSPRDRRRIRLHESITLSALFVRSRLHFSVLKKSREQRSLIGAPPVPRCFRDQEMK
jgi:hypothetical protein